MLKRLLSRDTKSKVAKRVKDSLEPDAQADGSQADTATLSATAPVATPQVVRRAKSMRDSDIKDEHGRSAEELAAEAALEFDIMGLAKRVNEMADAPVAKPAAQAEVKGAGEYGVPGKTPAPVAPPRVVAPVPASALKVEDGHIVAPAAHSRTAEETLQARDLYWDQFGTSDEAFLAPEDTPARRPDWPTKVRAFRIVRTNHSLIVASDGLSDPFDRFQGPADQNGHGEEVFIEVPGLQAAKPDLIRNSWIFRAVEYGAELIAHNGGIGDLLDEHGVMSVELASDCAPRDWIVSGVAEPAGALLDVPMPRGRNVIADMPLSPVRVIPMTLIFPEEIEDCIVGGAKERAALVNDLLTTGQGHKTDTARASLR